MFKLQDFSNEVLEIIFGHIPLLELTEISPRFNNIISRSTPLMQKLVFVWSSKEQNRLEVPVKHRKYKTLQVEGIRNCCSKLKNFCETFADTLVVINFVNCSIPASYLRSLLLKVAPTLENLSFINTNVLHPVNVAKIEMLKLKVLRFDKSTENCDVTAFVPILSTNSLENFMYDEIVSKSGEPVLKKSKKADVLFEFLKHQTKLTTLDLRPSIMDAVIAYWLENKQLKLQIATLHLEFLYGSQLLNFLSHWKFLQSQRDSLKTLIVETANFNDEGLQDLLTLKLKELELFYCNLLWNTNRVTTNSTLEVLRINYKYESVSDDSINAIVHLLLSCKAVTFLEIAFKAFEDRFTPILNAIAAKTSITTLSIQNPGCVNAQTFPAVKNLRLGLYLASDESTADTYVNSVTEEEAAREMESLKVDIKRLVEANPQISTLTLDHRLKDDYQLIVSIKRFVPALKTITYKDFSYI